MQPSSPKNADLGIRLDGPETSVVRRPGILIVDDDEHMRRMLNLGLQGQAKVWLAASGIEAIELYRGYRGLIDLVLFDVRMPVLDGPQSLAALQRLNPDVSCCFMSGDLGTYTEQQLLEMGAMEILRKPFCLDEVARVLTLAAADRLAGGRAAPVREAAIPSSGTKQPACACPSYRL